VTFSIMPSTSLAATPVTHFALRPLDNVGVQYGLGALKAGAISMDQFLDLNEKVGGYDVDGNYRTARTVADTIALRAAYRSGRLTNAGGGLRDIPIIDYRAYADDDPTGGNNIHLRYHSFSMRERLKKANGDADNQVMLQEDLRYGLYSSTSPLLQFALDKMDEWIANIKMAKAALGIDTLAAASDGTASDAADAQTRSTAWPSEVALRFAFTTSWYAPSPAIFSKDATRARRLRLSSSRNRPANRRWNARSCIHRRPHRAKSPARTWRAMSSSANCARSE
jgi:hypothetical protein